MKKSKAVVAMIGIALIIAIGAMAGRTANAATPTIGLGTAANYSVLAGTPAVTNTGSTTTDRDVGIHPASAVTGFPPGIVGGTIHAGDAVALQAKSDLTVAYLDAAARPATATHVALGGLTLVGGVYNSGSATLDLTGTLTLNGQNDPNTVWIFQATSDLITASSSSVGFINGGSPCNVFWQVTSSATLGSGSSFVGTILAQTSITVTNGVTVNGRALARNGTVTLDNDRFLTASCNAVAVQGPASTLPPCEFMANIPNAPCAGTRPAATTRASATQTPSAATVAPAVATATPAVAAAATPAAVVAAVQTLPSTSTDGSMNPLIVVAVALAGLGVLMLARRPIGHR